MIGVVLAEIRKENLQNEILQHYFQTKMFGLDILSILIL
jgi:hypothetical protein